jgi:hypothetical protein
MDLWLRARFVARSIVGFKSVCFFLAGTYEKLRVVNASPVNTIEELAARVIQTAKTYVKIQKC